MRSTAAQDRRHSIPRAAGVLCALLVALPAQADRLAVADFRFLQAPPALHGPVLEILTQALQASGWELIVPAGQDPRTALSVSSGCVAGPCLARRARALRAEQLLTGAVQAHGSSSYDLTLSLLDPEGGAVIAQITKRCDVCNYGDVTAAVARAATALRAAAQEALRVQGWLEVRTTPPDATVHVDGAPVGRAPLRRLVGAGPHRLAAFQGQRSARRTVILRPGETVQHTLRLVAGRPANAPPRRSTFARWIGWSLVGVGAAAAAGGGAVWSQAAGCEGSCSDTRRGLGGGLVGGGVAAIGAGALVLILDRLGCRGSAGGLALDAAPDGLRLAFTYSR